MGNCQAAEAATVVIEHPGGKVERVYWSVSASEVMGSNPGHYIAVVVAAPPNAAAHVAGKVAGRAADGSSSSAPVRHLKLLRPDDTLHIGHVYRLISFEEVLKELAAKKHVKLSRLLLAQKQHEEKKKRRERSGSTTAHRSHDGASAHSESSSSTVEHPQQQQQQQQQQLRQAYRPREGEEEEEDVHATRMGGSRIISGGRHGGAATRHGQWRPSLQSIAEAGN